ncbi:MAG: HlyD family efflux transporter periplasmic adaptor subunit [Mesorhizobium sp.]|nr:MAG: HlyD family efflux transporter periplasmic adaptor subunit [Mesorhizobium sp.]
MRSLWLKRSGAVLALAAVAGGFAYALREQPSLVDVALVSEGPMRVTIKEEGVTRVRDVYTVSTAMAGHLARSVLEEGDSVKANETVVASIHPLDPPLIDKRTEAELLAARDAARSAVGIAEIELQRSETALKLVEDDLERALKLIKPGVISEAALQRANNEVELRRVAVEAAKATIGFRRAELASAEARLLQPDPLDPTAGSCCVNLLAPVDGTVLAVFAKSEQAVVPGMKIAEIGDTGALEITVDLLSADAVRISTGTKAVISDWGGDQPLNAIVRRVDPAGFTKVSAHGIEEQRVNAVIDLDKPERRLGHGYRVFAEMTIWECGECLQVPISALFRNGSQWNVFVVRDGRLEQAELQVGHMNDEVAEILKGGVAVGDRIVVHPADTLTEGTLVEQRN